jgi:hypothetical protein
MIKRKWNASINLLLNFTQTEFDCIETHNGHLISVEEVMSVSQYGTADDAKAMLERAVAALKENKTKAIDMFNKGEGGFKDTKWRTVLALKIL